MMDLYNMTLLLILTMCSCSVGATFQFGNNRISNWKLQLSANVEENEIKFCRYNAPRNENICFQKDELISKCRCTVSNFTESESLKVSCLSPLADCPKRLSFSLWQGSGLKMPPDALEIVLFLSLSLNVLLIIVVKLFFNYRARVNSYFMENWQQYVNGASINAQLLRTAG
ncbi:Hypothetical predicted protein [Cloeon dipterum]|uniref:Phlebovirus glycoprotein G2 fusion domain-containing protein n=1 Tax=Cloeon dipterum TaxID=197152 RepID=A0A8S1BXP6_9INSE|nr:Hypothetical predicted protein [Cloeon dipterum]